MNHDGKSKRTKARMKMLSQDIQDRMVQVDKEWNSFTARWDICSKDVANEIAMESAAFRLTRWYNGVEDICKRIIESLDGENPENKEQHIDAYTGKITGWHKSLLDNMASETETHGAIFTPEVRQLLETVIRFRHVGRKQYGNELQFGKMKDAVDAAIQAKPNVVNAFNQLCDNLES